MAVTGPTNVATWRQRTTRLGNASNELRNATGIHGNLQYLWRGGGRAHQQAEGLGHQGGAGGQGHEEQVAAGLRGLFRHPVHDAAVHDGAEHLQRHQRTPE